MVTSRNRGAQPSTRSGAAAGEKTDLRLHSEDGSRVEAATVSPQLPGTAHPAEAPRRFGRESAGRPFDLIRDEYHDHCLRIHALGSMHTTGTGPFQVWAWPPHLLIVFPPSKCNAALQARACRRLPPWQGTWRTLAHGVPAELLLHAEPRRSAWSVGCAGWKPQRLEDTPPPNPKAARLILGRSSLNLKTCCAVRLCGDTGKPEKIR